MKIASIVTVCVLGLAAVACGGNEPAPADPSTTNATTEPAPAADMPAQPEATVEPAKPVALEALNKPASTWEAGGKSLSQVSGDELAAALKKAGWIKGTSAEVTTGVFGQYESISIALENKAGKKGTFKLIRPVATPGAPETVKEESTTAGAKSAFKADTSAMSYDETADVFVSIELADGKAADAKKALDGVAKPGKSVGTTDKK